MPFSCPLSLNLCSEEIYGYPDLPDLTLRRAAVYLFLVRTATMFSGCGTGDSAERAHTVGTFCSDLIWQAEIGGVEWRKEGEGGTGGEGDSG